MRVQKREKSYPDEGVKKGYLEVAVRTIIGNHHEAQEVDAFVGLETTFIYFILLFFFVF